MAKAKGEAKLAVAGARSEVGSGVTYIDGEGTEHAGTVTEAYDGGTRLSIQITKDKVLKHDVIHEDIPEEQDARVGRWK